MSTTKLDFMLILQHAFIRNDKATDFFSLKFDDISESCRKEFCFLLHHLETNCKCSLLHSRGRCRGDLIMGFSSANCHQSAERPTLSNNQTNRVFVH